MIQIQIHIILRLLDKQGNLRGILKPQPKGLYLQDSQSSGHDSYGVYKRFIRFLSIYHNLVSEGPCPHPLTTYAHSCYEESAITT